MRSFRSYILSVMKGERRVGVDRFAGGMLCFFSWFYAIGIKIVDWAYRSGLRKAHRVSVPVVSVGNITLGGTGKTPFSMFAAEYFKGQGRKPAILMRGYGGDENRMITDELPDVPVFTGQDRVRGARRAVSCGRDILILDDGFQHRRIARDLDILMIDGVSFSGKRRIFPHGVFREPLSSAGRSDIIVLTKAEKAPEGRGDDIVKRLRKEFPDKPVAVMVYRPSFLTDAAGAMRPVDSLRGKKVSLVSGIADPDHFAFLAERSGAVIVARRDYDDHHRYSQSDICDILRESGEKQAENILVTGKDMVKMKDLDISGIEARLLVLNITVDIIEGKESLIAGFNSVISGQGR
ncbi:MAG: tetraacyldisaccharide 4'-kinase [Candidatus Omnitrophota bacterium]